MTADTELGSLGKEVLRSFRARALEVFPAQMRTCLERLSEEQVWWRPNPASNSAGNLVLHTCGSMREFLNRRLGGFPYERNRPGEFEARQGSKSELLALLDLTLSEARTTFDRLTPERLLDPSAAPETNRLLLEDLLNQTVHVAAHAAQIAYLTKLQLGGGLDELWMHSHRAGGAWKPA